MTRRRMALVFDAAMEKPEDSNIMPLRPTGSGGWAEAWRLEGPVVAALLEALDGHALVLDPGLRVVGCDPGAPLALGLDPARGVLPDQPREHFARAGYALAGTPLPLGEDGHHLWIFRTLDGRGAAEARERLFLQDLLAAQPLRSLGGPHLRGLGGAALDLYRDLVLPRLQAEVTLDPAGEEGEPAARVPTVLVVDDSPMVRQLLRTVLGREFKVIAAVDGEQAVAMAQAYLPDLILMDAIMPVMDGFSACLLLKADPRTVEIPVLFLSALQNQAGELRALEAGAIDFIQKPVNAAAVLARLRNHLDQKLAKDRLAVMAAQDGLTGLANRRHFDHQLSMEWQRCRREGTPLSLIMADVDAFKAYNDTYGHVQGDACLRALAAALRSALRRPADLAARYGGEEFVCLLPGTDAAGARALADALEAVVAGLRIPHETSPVGPDVSISLGAATAYPALDDLPSLLVEEADRRMYEAKRRARARAARPADKA